MQRRQFILSPLLLGALQVPTTPSFAVSRFEFEEATVASLQERMRAGHLTAAALTRAYLDRIEAVDRQGPALHAVIEVNPEAEEIARALDRERAAGKVRGPLHGIPVLIKDNIATGDRMLTTAGSLALAHGPAHKDAHIVTRLREAGTVLLGKTNLSEWANIRSTRSTSGWSGRGGLTKNPYALDRNTSGSSSGSGAAASANLAALAVGTETDGSIVSPSSINGLVGIKPTIGLCSRHGIIPISHTQDTPGPMARTVADAAALLAALAGPDPADPVTLGGRVEDYRAALKPGQLKGARLGIVRSAFGNNNLVNEAFEPVIAMLAAAGAVLIDPVVIPNAHKYGDSELSVLLYELKADLPRYLAEFAPDAPIKSLADAIAWNRAHADAELRYFGQELFEQAEALGTLADEAYRTALENDHRYARTEGLDVVLREQQLDALIAPTNGPAWVTDWVNGDHSGASFSTPAAVAGYPHITVPAVYVAGLPVGLSFVGPAFSEARLIGYAYDFEQRTAVRRPPEFKATIGL